MSPASTNERPGFWTGFSTLFSGLGFVLKTPRCWPYALVPVVILLTLATASVAAAVLLVRPAIETWMAPESSAGQWGATLAGWLVALAASALGLVLTLAVTPPLSGPALENIVSQQEQVLGVPPRAPLGFFREMWFGVRAWALSALFAGPILLILWVLSLLVPGAGVVTLPLELIVASLALAWNLFDYPLTLRGVRMRERLALIRSHTSAVLGFGLAFALLFWVPCFQVLMLPVGVAAATRLLTRILVADSGVLPTLPRPAATLLSSDPPRFQSGGAT